MHALLEVHSERRVMFAHTRRRGDQVLAVAPASSTRPTSFIRVSPSHRNVAVDAAPIPDEPATGCPLLIISTTERKNMHLSKADIPVKVSAPGAVARQLPDFGVASGAIGAEYSTLSASPQAEHTAVLDHILGKLATG